MPAAHGELPAPVPPITPETAAFWEATAEGRLLLSHCPACDTLIWYPRAVCPSCHHNGTDWVEAGGQGTIHSFTVVRRGMGPYADAGPYVLAYVELDEGLRVMTNVVGAEPETLAVGDQVRVVFADTGEGSALPRFTPVRAS